MITSARQRRPDVLVLLVLCLAAPILLTPWVHGDGIGYVAWLRSAVVDHDLALGNEYAYLGAHAQADALGLPGRLLARRASATGLDPAFHAPRLDPATGRVADAFSVGPALLWAPAYVLAHALAAARGAPGADGYGGACWWAIALTTFALGATGAWLAYRFAARAASTHAAAWAALACVWAMPLVYYLYLAPSYSHALSAFAAGAFFAHWAATRGARGAGAWLARGALVGLLFLLHWNDVLLAAPVLALEAWRLARAPRGGPALALAVAASAAGFALVAWPQFAAWQVIFGRPWVRQAPGFVALRPEGLWLALVSARHGLFTWTPIALLAVAGLVRLARRERELALVSLAALALLLATNACVPDWWAGASFGARRFTSATPLFALGLAAAFDDLAALVSRGARAAWLAPAVFAVFAAWNVLLLGQYALGMIDHSGPVPFATMAANQPRVLARVLALAHEVAR